jgi:Fe-S cluster biogenesis protein NfuA
MKEKVEEVINELRPFLMNDGGNVELIKIEDNIVYIAFQGACAGCALRDMTLTEGIEKTIKEKVPEIKEVRLVN